MEKNEIRSAIKNQLTSQKLEQKIKNEKLILKKVLNHPQVKKAKTISVYYPLSYEVNTKALIYKLLLNKKEACIPHLDLDLGMTMRLIDSIHFDYQKDLKIRQPLKNSVIVLPQDIDLVIMPGLAFDLHKNRLGTGKGYYDKYLVKTNAFKMMIAFESQKVPKIISQEHDVQVDAIVTEKNIY